MHFIYMDSSLLQGIPNGSLQILVILFSEVIPLLVLKHITYFFLMAH